LRQFGSFANFLANPLARRLSEGAKHSGWVVCEVVSTRGSYKGAKPLAASGDPNTEMPFAALTLGRTRPRSLVRFLGEGARLDSFLHAAPGMVSAFSAGLPLTGNCTFSIWRT